MKLTQQVLDLNWEEVKTKITRFIRDYVEKANANGIVLGLSGGVDSSTAAALSALAIGGSKVLGLMLPEKETYNPLDIKHAKLVAEKFGIKTETIDITSTLEALQKSIPIFDLKDKLSKGNLKARTRMLYLYYYANKLNLIVCGSSDKSEVMIGYFTKWGDAAADIAPLMDLYKTQVRKLARHVGVPDEIVDKPPSPMLWPGQTAEEEIGLKYEILDLVLYGLEHFMKTEQIAEELGLPKDLVEKVKKRWKAMEHKRRLPLTTKLQYRTVGFDFRIPLP
ncbi:MAG: NAD+ synthase [Candidatus Bathyarchaeia archaeon]|nr:NAD+ synthase [Candidatus Bathyarchaeota archaeon]